tara:strand:- start:1238 stop:1930 length:693 start_codon:yes stop_codon:yes gene_type:complete
MKQPTILIVDDENDIIDLLSYNLKTNNYNVETACDGSEALLKINNNIDLILLDVMMPKIDGIEVCKSIKKNPSSKNIPVILLTAKSTSQDEYEGLISGADDYIKKPISIKNLLLRIKNILNRVSKKSFNNILKYGSISLNLETIEVYNKNTKINLTKTEFDLLSLFIKSPNKVFTREEILNKIWGYDTIVTDRTIDVHINKLRKKIEQENRVIFSSHGRGYYLDNSNEKK